MTWQSMFRQTGGRVLWLALGVAVVVFAGCAVPPGGGEAGQSLAARAAGKYSPVPVPERPGLATGWGDEVKSEVTMVDFQRASSKPAGTDVIWYNDKEGLKAMAGDLRKVGALQTAAGGMVEWGIKGRFGFLPAFKSYNSYYFSGRRFVQGRKGSSYSIYVKNRCKSPLEILASVDGLDVMDGKPASYRKRGYIIDPGEALEIKGFRTSTDKVAGFKFSGVSNSYANMRHGDTRNVGVIGLAVFTKRGTDPWKWMPSEVKRRDTARAFAEAP